MRAPALGAVTWRASSRSSGNNNCVEVASVQRATAVRDSKDPHGPAFVFAGSAWTAFLASIKNGELDR